MKKLLLTINLVLFTVIVSYAQEQTPATEAGEDFDLSGIMAVLENAKDLADFEKQLNNEENQINNLDLNKDDEIDIVKVVEVDDANTHVIILRAVLGENEYQDIASIEIEKHSDTEISLQVIGDPDLYGPDYVVEPAPEESKSGEKGGGDFYDSFETNPYLLPAVFVSVHRWRPIGPLFVVGRVAFVSAVGWRPVAVWFIVRRPIARSTWRARSRRYSKNRYRQTKSRHSKRGRNVYSTQRKKSSVAKKNAGPKPSSPGKKGPTTQPKKNTKLPVKTTNTQQKKKNTKTTQRRRNI